ncbi:hypothetical protein FHT39_003307 [Mitsuaria sp. BK045]|uniref:hypothetical protein n=1 Tax=unclassified Roseateles TaxID=2626991 RepID=UPI0016081B94|nr:MULTISPECIES: hypothetical protein [unclassified Roseateles]MBB3294627.1 hypothetical protein [Mitsuaria sp. BK041]MBB3363843.1 hypothetical protein [Mitsuaria sp. BK045]
MYERLNPLDLLIHSKREMLKQILTLYPGLFDLDRKPGSPLAARRQEERWASYSQEGASPWSARRVVAAIREPSGKTPTTR